MTKKGFTLIELLVVIVIIGILATIGVAQFSSYFGKARDAKRKTAVAQVKQIIMAQATEEDKDYTKVDGTANTAAKINAVLTANGFTLKAEQDLNYSYYADADDFVVAVCSEADSAKAIVAGTATATEAGLTCDTDGALQKASGSTKLGTATGEALTSS